MADVADIEALEAAVASDPGGAQFPVLAEAYRRAGRHDDARRVAVAGLAERPDDAAGRLALGLTLLDLGEAAAARYELERAMGSVTDHPAIATVPSRDLDATFDGGLAGAPRDEFAETQPDIAGSAIDDDELEAAFADAESVPEEMIDANRIAAQAIVDGELDEPEGFALEEAEAFEPDEGDFQFGTAPTFATETMARLLADQGDADGAEAIRVRLGQRRAVPLEPAFDAAEVPAALPQVIPAAAAPPRSLDASETTAAIRAGSTGSGFAIGDDAYAIPSPASDEVEDAELAHRARTLATLETWLANLQRNHA